MSVSSALKGDEWQGKRRRRTVLADPTVADLLPHLILTRGSEHWTASLISAGVKRRTSLKSGPVCKIPCLEIVLGGASWSAGAGALELESGLELELELGQRLEAWRDRGASCVAPGPDVSTLVREPAVYFPPPVPCQGKCRN